MDVAKPVFANRGGRGICGKEGMWEKGKLLNPFFIYQFCPVNAFQSRLPVLEPGKGKTKLKMPLRGFGGSLGKQEQL